MMSAPKITRECNLTFKKASQRSVSGNTSSGYTSSGYTGFDAANVSKVESAVREHMLDFTCNHLLQTKK